MACWMAEGGVMFFTSTRFTLIPQASVASSRMARIFALMVSREVSVVSRSKSPMMLRSVVAERFSMARIGLSTRKCKFRIHDPKNTTESMDMGDVVLV